MSNVISYRWLYLTTVIFYNILHFYDCYKCCRSCFFPPEHYNYDFYYLKFLKAKQNIYMFVKCFLQINVQNVTKVI